MSRIALLGITLLVLLAVFPLVSIGTTTGPPVLWWIGLALLLLAALVPPILRYAGPEDEDETPEKDEP